MIFITSWLIYCIMSYLLWQLKCHYGLEYRHVWSPFFATLNGCDPHHTELCTLTCEGLAPLYKYSSYSSPDMLSPHGFQLLNMPQILTRKIPTIATWMISFQNYWCFTRSFYICSVFWDGSKIVATCCSQYSFESCCYCCCFHKPSEWIVKRMWLFLTDVFNQRFRNAGNKLYNVRVLENKVNRGLCVTMHWTCSDVHYSCTTSNITHLWHTAFPQAYIKYYIICDLK